MRIFRNNAERRESTTRSTASAASGGAARALRLRRGLLLRSRCGSLLDSRNQRLDDFRPDQLPLRHHIRAMHDVAQLADVSGPGVGLKEVDGLLFPTRHAGVLLLLDQLAKVLRQDGDVVEPL